jgi:maleylacetoacetate isomerase
MRFHGYFRSSAAYRCRIAFNLKGVHPQLSFHHLRKGEQRAAGYLAINPQGLVPALETDDGAVIAQSLAIIEWLEEKFPQPAFLPRDPDRRAEVRAFALAIACEIHPLQNLRVLNHLRDEFRQDQAGLDRWCRKWVGEGLAACEAVLARRAQAWPFCFGDRPGLADIFLVPQAFSADRFGVDLSAMPRIRAIRAACEAMPQFADAHPSRQPDAES